MTETPNKGGRPSKYSDELTETICQRMAEGESLRAICREDAMPDKTTVLRWLKAHPEFVEPYTHAREMQADHFAEEILEIADDATNDFMEKKRRDGSVETVVDNENVQRSRLRVDSRKWLMSKMMPKKYGDRTALEHSGNVGLTHEDLLKDLK